jgi:hypothetical protein
MPLAHNGYCPSHQHLAETEDPDFGDAAPVRDTPALDQLRAA